MDRSWEQDQKYLDSLKHTDKVRPGARPPPPPRPRAPPPSAGTLTPTRAHTPQSKRNTNSVAYDPITLKYNDSEDGKRLLYSDQHVRYRAALRAKFLNDKMCTNDYNIITGGDLSTTTNLPSKPTMERPSHM